MISPLRGGEHLLHTLLDRAKVLHSKELADSRRSYLPVPHRSVQCVQNVLRHFLVNCKSALMSIISRLDTKRGLLLPPVFQVTADKVRNFKFAPSFGHLKWSLTVVDLLVRIDARVQKERTATTDWRPLSAAK